jgi:hypothetical protein
VERFSEREKEEIARLSAMGLPSRLIGAQIGRHRSTVWGYVARLRRPVGRRRRCRVRSRPTVGGGAIGPAPRTERRCSGHVVRSGPSWRRALGFDRWWNRGCSWGGRRSRSRVGW